MALATAARPSQHSLSQPPANVTASTLAVMLATLASMLLGFARDAMIAGLLGTGPVADAFLAAF